MRVSVLLSSEKLSLAQRWQLVSSLFDQVRSLIEGSVALFVTQLICGAYTGWPGFDGLAALTVGVTAARLLQWRRFVRARREHPGARSPEEWGRHYTLGVCVMVSLWAATVASVTFRIHDMQLLLFVLLIQNAWLAGIGVRNAASPLAIWVQTIGTVVPSIVCTALGANAVADGVRAAPGGLQRATSKTILHRWTDRHPQPPRLR
jgi:hypothetical protein